MLTVKETFFAGGTCYRQGSEVADTDPIVKGRELLFVRTVAGKTSAPIIETATASPGATRDTKRPASKPTKPAAARK